MEPTVFHKLFMIYPKRRYTDIFDYKTKKLGYIYWIMILNIAVKCISVWCADTCMCNDLDDF